MEKAKGPPTSIIFDLVNPNREMFTRDGEVPAFVITAVHPAFSDLVGVARKRVLEALEELMERPENSIVVMQQAQIEMESGDVMTLTRDSLVLSLMYDTGEPKLLHLELAEPNQVTIH